MDRWIVVTTLISAATGLNYNLERHTYDELLITISPDIKQDLVGQQQVVDGVKSWIREGSSTLFKSTRGWASINTVKILLPATWTDIPNTTEVDGIVFEDGNIRVDLTSGVYGDSPFTVQTGGCGDPGQYIQVSGALLQDLAAFASFFGPPGQVFVHEWAKYRYGVFEEHGYPGDEKYPMFYVKTAWTANGEESILQPNFCLNTVPDYTIESTEGDSCSYNEATGLPGSHCVFVPKNTSGLRSSIMALPYVEGNFEFCDDSETFLHDISLPTKHNALCHQQSTFSVILKHADFANYVVQNSTTESSTTFQLLRPKPSASFVMVLDVSGSMDQDGNNRIGRMRDSAVRWVNFDLQENVPLGIVKFSSTATELFPLTQITSDNRAKVVQILRSLAAGGGTCLGAALKKGLDTLKLGGVSKGGVMLFMTDGEQSCDGPDKTDIPQVIDAVVAQGVRVIAIAFGSKADQRILELAERTQGKAYFIPDNTGPEDINNALQGSLTFQPSVPSDEIAIVIAKETFKNQNRITLPFIIDATIGNEVVVQVDFFKNKQSTITIGNYSSDVFTEENGVYEKKFEILPSGEFSVEISSSGAIPFASITVTSKSANGTLPIVTRCWTSTGTETADLSLGGKIAVIAQVLQGSNPVIRAKVKAYIERDGTDAPLEVELYDKGAEPDNIKDDGIYSRYFTSFVPSAPEVRYTLKCQVESTDESAVNQGFLDARKEPNNLLFGRSLPKRPSGSMPACCGSSTVTDDSVLTETGQFGRTQTGGMISIENANSVTYPPGTVTDLWAGKLDPAQGIFSIMFTSPGAVLDSGTVDAYNIYYTTNQSLLLEADRLDDFDSVNGTFLAPGSSNMTAVEAGLAVELVVKTAPFLGGNSSLFFFQLEARAGAKTSKSNIARLYMKHIEGAWSGKAPLMNVGSRLLIIFLVILTFK